MPPPRPASLKVRALQWLAQREHSRVELRDRLLRLLKHGGDDRVASAPAAQLHSPTLRRAAQQTAERPEALDPETEVEALLAWLEQRGYLSDARFAESRVHARQARYGNQRIRQELRQHGVALDTATADALASTEFSRACTVWQRKFDAPAGDAAGRLRQMRFLVGRGFSLQVVQRVLKEGGAVADPSDTDTTP
jgi:regulatory protein